MGRLSESRLSKLPQGASSPAHLGQTGGDRVKTSPSFFARRRATMDSYPYTPSLGKTDASFKAANATAPKFNEKQRKVMSRLGKADLTNTEIFALEAGLSPDELKRYCELRSLERGLQPRSGELSLKGLIFDTGRTRKNPNGRAETVWTSVDPSKPTTPTTPTKQGRLL